MANQQIPGYVAKVPQPPPTGIPGFDMWLRQITAVVNASPRISWFSGTHPNLSKITGTAGDLAINLASGSTNSRAWIMGGAPTFSTTTGWVAIMVTPLP